MSAAEPRLALRIIEDLRAVPAAAWDALVGAGGSPFLEWRFLQAFEESGCAAPDTGWQPLHLTLWEERVGDDGKPGERLVAAAPAYLKGHSHGEFVFDWEWAGVAERLGLRYYPKLLCAVPFTPAAGTRLLVHPDEPPPRRRALKAALARGLREVAEELKVSSVHVLFHPCADADEAPPEPSIETQTDEDAAALREAGFLRRLGVQFQWRNRGYRDFDDYLSRFNAKRRHMLRRERAEVAAQGVRVATRPGADLRPEDAALMHRLYVSTVDKFYWGRRYLNPRFFELLIDRAPDLLEFVVATDGSEVLGGAINFAKAGRLYGRYWGQGERDVRFLHFEVCYYHSIAEAIARGLHAFEPGAGGEHKVPRGFEPTLTASAHLVFDRRLGTLVRDHLRREESAIRAAVAEARAESPLRPR